MLLIYLSELETCKPFCKNLTNWSNCNSIIYRLLKKEFYCKKCVIRNVLWRQILVTDRIRFNSYSSNILWFAKFCIRKDKHKHKQDFRNCYRVHFWTRLNIQSSYSIRRYKNTWTESTIFHVPVISCSTQTKFSWFRLRWNKPKWNDAIYGIWKGKGLESFLAIQFLSLAKMNFI